MTSGDIDIGHGVVLKDELRGRSSGQLPPEVVSVFERQSKKFVELEVTEINYTAIPKTRVMGIEMQGLISLKVESGLVRLLGIQGELSGLFNEISDELVRHGGNFSMGRNVSSSFGSPCYIGVSGAFPTDPN